MAWIVKLEEVIDDEVHNQVSVMTFNRSLRLGSLDDLGLRLAEAKTLLACIQKAIVSRQIERDSEIRSRCLDCGHRRRIKDYRQRQFDTLFGRQSVRRPRFACRRCSSKGSASSSRDGLSGRSTPEFDSMRAKLAAHLPYRVAGQVLAELLPVSSGMTHETIRNHTLAVGRTISREKATCQDHLPAAPAKSLTLSLDTAYIRSTHARSSRHLHVLAGTIERDDGTCRRFAALEGIEETLGEATSHHLRQMGYEKATGITVLSDGEESLCKVAREATHSSVLPILDWFHIAMRVQHLKQIASGLSERVPTHAASKARIQAELEHLHWRLWHGRTNGVREIFGRLRISLGVFKHHVRALWCITWFSSLDSAVPDMRGLPSKES